MTTTSRTCPVCGTADPRPLFRQEFSTTDAAPFSGYDVVVCRRCGCGYADGIPGQEVFDRYYRAMSKYEYHQRDGAESDYDRRRLELTASTIGEQVSAREAHILDIGCATGRLLADLRGLGFSNVLGLDPSPSCAAAARRLYDIDVRTMTLGELAQTGETFDVAIMVGVLEHLRDLEAAFRNLHALIRMGGLLYVDVPDATTFAEWPNAPYQDFSTEHINFFAPVSLDNLMAVHGFNGVFLEQNYREQSYATVMSNISAIYRRESTSPLREIVFDGDTSAGLQRYIDQCGDEAERLRACIDALADSARPIVVWGVGTHTSRLMATSRLADANIVAFIESNARYHGKTLHGRPILPPEALRARQEAVLISSRVFQYEIAQQIREHLGCSNELLLLYKV
jgi:SAM-dependent methyltransferase